MQFTNSPITILFSFKCNIYVLCIILYIFIYIQIFTTRKVTKTNHQNQSNETTALKAEIKELEQQKQNSKSTESKTHKDCNITLENPKTTQHPKTVQKASEGGQLEKAELLSVITFIEETMKTLATYGKQLKSQLDINLITTEI